MAVFSSFAYTTESSSLAGATTWHISAAGFNWHMTAAPLMLIVCILLGWLLIRTLIVAVICFIADAALKSIPPQYRRQNPALIWLLLIPLFPFVWNYLVFPQIAKSFRDYFDAAGEKDRSDCGWAISIAMCICCDATLFRPVALVALICFLALLILTLLKFWELRRKALNLSATPPAADVEPMSSPPMVSPIAPGEPYSPVSEIAQGPGQPQWVVPGLIFLAVGFLFDALPIIIILRPYARGLVESGYSLQVLSIWATCVAILGGVAILIGATLLARAVLRACGGGRVNGVLAFLSALFLLSCNLPSIVALAATYAYLGSFRRQVMPVVTRMEDFIELLCPIVMVVFFYALASIIRVPQLRRPRYAKSLFRLLAAAVALVSTIEFAIVARHWLTLFLAHGMGAMRTAYWVDPGELTIDVIMLFLFLLTALAAFLALPARAD